MNELYKTATADFSSFLLFVLTFVLFGFSSLVLVCSAGKTMVDYYFLRKINFIKSLATIQKLADFVNSEESPSDKKY